MRFNQMKCRVLSLGMNNCMHQYQLGADLLERNSEDKDLDVLMDSRLARSQYCTLVAKKAIVILGYVKKSMVVGDDPPPLLCLGEATSRILCPVLVSLLKKDIIFLERVQQKAIKTIKDLRYPSYEERLSDLGLISL